MSQPPQPALTSTTQEAGPDADAAEPSDVDMADVPLPLEYAPVDMDNERKSLAPGEIYRSYTDKITASHLPATTAPQYSLSFRAPTIPRPEGYKTPPHGPSCSPITPPAQLATDNGDADQEISSLELPAPVAAANPLVPTTILLSSSFRTSTAPRPEDYETPPHVQSFSPLTPSAQSSAENNDHGRNSSPDERVVSEARDEPIAPFATQDYHAIESGNEEYSEREGWDVIPAPPPQELTGIDLHAQRAQGELAFLILILPPAAIHGILDNLLVYDEPIALVRKSPDRRLIEANMSHIVTVGKGKITREPQNKGLKSRTTRNLNTASPTNLFLVCRGLRDLGIKTYYNKNTFAFSDEQDLIGWAKSIGSRRKEVRKVELRSEWEVAFENNDIHSKDLAITGTGVLDTPALRVLENIERVDLDIALRMPWQRTGKLPDDYDKISLDAQKMCFEYGKRMVKAAADKFRRYELNTPLIEKHQHIWFDKAWEEKHYESASLKKNFAEYKRKLAEERAAEASSYKDDKDS